jgi:chromosome segregation ATPase
MQAQSSEVLERTKHELERKTQELDAIKENFTAELKNRTLALDHSKRALVVAKEQFGALEKQYAISQTMLSTKNKELETMEGTFKKQVTDMQQKSAQLSSQMQMQHKESALKVKTLTVQVADLKNEQSGALKKMQEVEQFNSTLKQQLFEAQVLRCATSMWHTILVGAYECCT